MLLLPPTLFAATVYMVLGRVIRLVGGDNLSIINPNKLTKIFVTSDVITLFIQSASAGFMVMTSNPVFPKIGKGMVLAGLVLQLISFALFFTITILFHLRIRKTPTTGSFAVDANWVQSLWMLYGISVLIIIRSIFRLIEYGAGDDGYPLSHEWTLLIFDTLLMVIACCLFWWRFPDNLKPAVEQAVYMENGHAGVESVQPKSALVRMTSE